MRNAPAHETAIGGSEGGLSGHHRYACAGLFQSFGGGWCRKISPGLVRQSLGAEGEVWYLRHCCHWAVSMARLRSFGIVVGDWRGRAEDVARVFSIVEEGGGCWLAVVFYCTGT